ncbi:MAG TPA: hypothetical protein ENJ60_16190 [Aeromonadales bacterium]|nr:hypothetical protein [Aeromonadales bacterium]
MQVYKDVLSGDLTPADAKEKLQSESMREGEEIFVTPEIVKGMLDKYLVGEVGAQRLSDWAGFLTSNDVYVTPGWEDDTLADKYEPMWEVLQRLSTPFIDDAISKDRVESYIVELLKIEK